MVGPVNWLACWSVSVPGPDLVREKLPCNWAWTVRLPPLVLIVWSAESCQGAGCQPLVGRSVAGMDQAEPPVITASMPVPESGPRMAVTTWLYDVGSLIVPPSWFSKVMPAGICETVTVCGLSEADRAPLTKVEGAGLLSISWLFDPGTTSGVRK